MIIYLLRHGDAEHGNDAQRILTKIGQSQIKTVSEIAKLLGAKPDIFLSSPLERAKQSGEIARDALNPKAEFRTENFLEPESSPAEVYLGLSKMESSKSIFLISHMPLIKNFLSELVGCQPSVEMKPGTLARIDTKESPAPESGILIWLLPQMQSLRC